MNSDDLVAEQLAENMRFYGDMRFKQLTLLMSETALALAGVGQYYGHTFVAGISMQASLAGFSLLFTSVIWVMEVRAACYWAALRDRVPNLWPRPFTPVRLVSSTTAVLVLLISLYSGWLWLVYQWTLSPCVWLGLAIGAALVVFSLWSYHRQGIFKKTEA